MFFQGGAVPHPFLMSILEHFKQNLQIDLNFSIKDLYITIFCCTFADAKVKNVWQVKHPIFRSQV